MAVSTVRYPFDSKGQALVRASVPTPNVLSLCYLGNIMACRWGKLRSLKKLVTVSLTFKRGETKALLKVPFVFKLKTKMAKIVIECLYSPVVNTKHPQIGLIKFSSVLRRKISP